LKLPAAAGVAHPYSLSAVEDKVKARVTAVPVYLEHLYSIAALKWFAKP